MIFKKNRINTYSTIIFFYFFLVLPFLLIISCSSKNFKESEKIFQATPSSNSVVGDVYFALYKNGQYKICTSGGVGEDCYSGEFKLDNDTITLIDLNKNIRLKTNRFLIIRYNEQDSSYWKSKYPHSYFSWENLKDADYTDGVGDIYGLDNNNKLMNTTHDSHFIIALDSLKIYFNHNE